MLFIYAAYSMTLPLAMAINA